MTAADAPLPARRWERLRRPAGAFEATRWVFALLAVASLVVALIAPLQTGSPAERVLALVCGAVLACSWSAGYLRQRALLLTDVLDAVALFGFTLAAPNPSAVFGLVFGGLWFRTLYGTTGRALLRCGLVAVALVATVPVSQNLNGEVADVGPLVGLVPTMFLTVVAGRHLAATVLARQQGSQRDAIQVQLGVQLLDVADAASISRIAWEATARICAVTPGLVVLRVGQEGATRLRVEGAVGDLRDVPPLLTAPADWLDDVRPHAVVSGQVRRELDAAVGATCDWTRETLPPWPNRPRSWLLLGFPGTMPAEVVVSITSVATQVALAMRNSEAQHVLTLQATRDPLTGLPNRAAFTAALTEVLGEDSPSPPTVLFVDLDDFKDVNDLLGHAAGDELLREIAARLRRVTRPGDLCARLGGDEFAVLLRDADTVAAEVAQRIVAEVAVPVLLGSAVAQVGASVGVASATAGTDVEALVHSADVAMYAAKASGKGRIQVFEPGLLRARESALVVERRPASAASSSPTDSGPGI